MNILLTVREIKDVKKVFINSLELIATPVIIKDENFLLLSKNRIKNIYPIA